jgi:molecular chaperone GrpE
MARAPRRRSELNGDLMTDEPNTPRPDAAIPPHAEADPALTPEQQNMEQLVSGAAKLAEKVSTLEGQIADLTDRLLRAHAEMDNLRKRAAKEKEDTAKYAIQKFASDVVGVADNFERAITSVPAGAAAEDTAFKSLLDGVSLTEREFLNVLERHGVRRIAPQGQPFNPHQHQAVMEAQDPSVPPGTIVQVYQNGYAIEDRVLRPAMVVVAKGGAKPSRPSEAPEQQGGAAPRHQSQPQHIDPDDDAPPPPDRDIIL